MDDQARTIEELMRGMVDAAKTPLEEISLLRRRRQSLEEQLERIRNAAADSYAELGEIVSSVLPRNAWKGLEGPNMEVAVIAIASVLDRTDLERSEKEVLCLAIAASLSRGRPEEKFRIAMQTFRGGLDTRVASLLSYLISQFQPATSFLKQSLAKRLDQHCLPDFRYLCEVWREIAIAQGENELATWVTEEQQTSSATLLRIEGEIRANAARRERSASLAMRLRMLNYDGAFLGRVLREVNKLDHEPTDEELIEVAKRLR